MVGCVMYEPGQDLPVYSEGYDRRNERVSEAQKMKETVGQ